MVSPELRNGVPGTPQVWCPRNSALNRPLLTELARLTGGRVFELADVRQLDDSIPMREVTRTLETRDELWDAPLLFSAIILGLTAEWVLRKVYRMV